MSVDRIVETVADAAPEIRAGLPGRRTYADEENPSGEYQLAADVYADRLLEERLLALDAVASYASEEREEITWGGGENGGGRGRSGKGRSGSGSENGGGSENGTETVTDGAYHVALDPLDGSSNLKSNNPMGTILAVYDESLPASGRALVAAAYVLFGPITTMVIARNGRVREYVLEEGERTVVDEDLAIHDEPVVYGFGGRAPDWPEPFEAFVREIEDRELKLRYGGAMIADVNQVLTYGGIFGYPGLQSRPEGKLRLQFECNPIAYIVESAGGRSSDGGGSVLDVDPTDLHQRTPVHVGNGELIEQLESTFE